MSSSTTTTNASKNTFFDLHAKNNAGEAVDFSAFKGKVVLAVNVARLWDVQEVPGLIALGKKYTKDLQLLFFPCNQFCSEEPGTPSDIAKFYVQKHKLPSEWLMERADVNGTDTQPTYVFLKNALRGKIAWNFTKFVIGRDGNVLARFGQDVKPDQLEKNIPSWIGWVKINKTNITTWRAQGVKKKKEFEKDSPPAKCSDKKVIYILQRRVYKKIVYIFYES